MDLEGELDSFKDHLGWQVMSFLLFENTCLLRPSFCNLRILVLLGDLILLMAPEAFPIIWSCVRSFESV